MENAEERHRGGGPHDLYGKPVRDKDGPVSDGDRSVTDQTPSDVPSEKIPPDVPGESSERLARDTVYQLLAVRARSRAELMRALRSKGIEHGVAEVVLGKFVDAGLVDDAVFAEHWVESRQRYRGLGRRALGYELRNKGVDEQTVADALSQVDEESEADRARDLIRRRLASRKPADGSATMRRLLGMLARKGYSEGLAFRVVREELENSGLNECRSDAEYNDL